MQKIYIATVLLITAVPAWGQSKQSPEALFQEIEKRYKGEMLPKALRPPVAVEQADAYASGVKFFREGAKKDLELLQAVKPDNDDRRMKSDKERLIYWLSKGMPQQLDESLEQTRRSFANAIATHTDFIKFAADIDMNDQDKVRNNLANPDNLEQRETAIREATMYINVLQRIDEQLGEKSQWPEKRKEFEGIVAKFQQNVAVAAAKIMPPKDIGDTELRKIAEETLKDPKYGAKAWKRLIVNSPKQVKQFSTYEVQDRMIVRYDYDFDFFQATTIEEEGGKLFMYTNTIAFYRSGRVNTPLKRWVVRERFRGAMIVAENVGK